MEITVADREVSPDLSPAAEPDVTVRPKSRPLVRSESAEQPGQARRVGPEVGAPPPGCASSARCTTSAKYSEVPRQGTPRYRRCSTQSLLRQESCAIISRRIQSGWLPPILWSVSSGTARPPVGWLSGQLSWAP